MVKIITFNECALIINTFLIGQHVVVTGGSSGIGLWAAIFAARKGADVTIVARNIKILGTHPFLSYQ